MHRACLKVILMIARRGDVCEAEWIDVMDGHVRAVMSGDWMRGDGGCAVDDNVHTVMREGDVHWS